MSTDAIKSFTYILKFKPTNQWYYGVRWAVGCSPDDLWTTYYSSSTAVLNLIKEFGKDAFEFRVSRVFDTVEKAIAHEKRFLERVKAASNGAFINKRNNMPDFSPKGLTVIHHTLHDFETWHDPSLPIPEGWKVGHSKKHKASSSKVRKGKNPWNKGKVLGPYGPHSDERIKNISNGRLNTTKIGCVHCGKEVDPGNYKRFHGDMCKHNPNVDKSYWDDVSKLNKKSVLSSIETGNFNNFGRKDS